jgi:ABC-type molybdenum transport system ATPase subunit/photorepair protein PhrA
MATLAQQMENAAKQYKEATPVVDAMNVMKEMYGAGQLSEEEMAKNLGLISGRFGAQTPEAESLRTLVQSILARPIATTPRAPYKDMTEGTPQIMNLVRKAMSR